MTNYNLEEKIPNIEMEVYNGVIDMIEQQNELLYALSKIAVFLCENKDSSYHVSKEIELLRNFIKYPGGEAND